MGNAIQGLLDLVIKVIDAVPLFKRYRTVILIGGIGGIALLDAIHVGPGNLYPTYSPYLWPIATATALAHVSPAQDRAVVGSVVK